MPIPSMNQTTSAALRIMAGGGQHAKNDLLSGIYAEFRMTDEERAEKTAGGRLVVKSRMLFALLHLKRAGLIKPIDGKTAITESGRGWAASRSEFRLVDLKEIPEYADWWNTNVSAKSEPPPTEDDPQSPDEELDGVLKKFKAAQIEDMRARLADIDDYRFERIVVDLLAKMGYGSGTVTRRSRDKGIDGVMGMDRLGIGKVYVQAKRWSGKVGSKDLQAFTGALTETKTKRGVFITTSGFTPEAIRHGNNASVNMVLVGGDDLLELMYEYGVGFASEERIEIKSVDDDYFSE